ncbi:peptidase dimerization [Novosphingobium aromaticivorans DSM 12444]|uniref:Peptidase dimerization n=1 Tax=Novosphingobium aromaticivorans (strain ATCC 700278 / DSM 12444 / CCUG 56034 / CIP 105152 / NBRC 16084 / F199) TaxID=279238 RepID=Q2G9Z4_NOVAD|nr:hydrolase [Novosphingobium aromaticivorans]ABD25329.1 peptidase dimerization [Novosphingobium aromaticivorans DSM 12444]SCX90171.1 glutamate carboxypeptidase [Novosphingobium aromaticivorans]
MQQLSTTERSLVEGIDAAAMLARVEAWCALNTGTGNLDGLARQWDLLADAFAALPGTIRKVASAPVTAIGTDGRERETANGAHFVLSVRPDAPRRYLLTGHMDTVFGPSHPFQTLRWLDGETLGGPGVADMKGGIAVILAALAAFEKSPVAPSVGYDVMINSDEETGSLSSAALIAELARGKAAALTYEPSALPDGTLAGERPGSGNYSAIVKGRSAHAGRNPQDGRNAILAAADLALRLKALQEPGLSVNPARIDGGSANNVVPDHAILRFNVRPRLPEQAARFDAALRDLILATEAAHEVSIHLHGGVSRPPKPLTAEAGALFGLVRECGEALGQPIRWQASGGVCDGNNIAACGVPVVDTMGVRGGAIHSDQEFLIVPSLAERAALSALVLHRLSGGNR